MERPLQIKFDPNQDYQIEAVESVIRLFEGTSRRITEFALSGEIIQNIPQSESFSESWLRDNLREVQEQNTIVQPSLGLELEVDDGLVLQGAGDESWRYPSFTIEMETGTGKTYVYLRTIYELRKHYGFSKFIIVVPSIAIYEGVIKNFEITKDHFRAIYGNEIVNLVRYDGSQLSRLRSFATSTFTEVLVITLDSFNKASNNIYKTSEKLPGERKPYQFIQELRPILILDEPQNMESPRSKEALRTLHPLLALRYSATHRTSPNLIYRLTPFDAYRRNLVKKIQVLGVTERENFNQPFLALKSISLQNGIIARVTTYVNDRGLTREADIILKQGDNLYAKTGREEHKDGYRVAEINAVSNTIQFDNGLALVLNATIGPSRPAIFQVQIERTIEQHMEMQERLLPKGIKVLSLFFIDRVANYTDEKGLIKRLFDEAFQKLKGRYAYFRDFRPEDVREAYFAKSKEGRAIDTESRTTGEREAERSAFELIMRQKEQLLSLTEHACFIFAHSALREGWDNPNVFQICTLNQTVSEVKKRQEIGRGVRLAVNQTGERIHDEKINVLTVVANESYEHYVERLQSEIVEEYGIEGLPPKPANARQRGVAQLRKEFTLRPEFKELWERIKYHTRYAVSIDTEALIEDVLQELDQVAITAPQIAITRARVEVEADDRLEAITLALPKKEAIDLSGRRLPNVIDIMDNLMEYTTPPVSLTRGTLLEIFRRSSNKQTALANPHAYATEAVRIIKSKLVDQLVSGIKYTKMNEWYEMTQLEESVPSWEEYLIPAPHSVYDHVIYDSDEEKRFVERLERNDNVKLYLKLPRWFMVPTPVGSYNPDWAIVLEERDAFGQPTDKPLLYLVRETKSTTELDELRPDERRKIHCGESHFQEALGVSYRVMTASDQLV